MDKLEYSRGAIYYTELVGPEGSHVQHGRRPVVIVSSLIGNLTSDLVIVLPFTTKIKNLSINVLVDPIFDDLPTQVICNQVFTIPKSQLEEHLGYLSDTDMEKVERALLTALGMTGERRDEMVEITKKFNDYRDRLERVIPEVKEYIKKLNNLVDRAESLGGVVNNG